MIVRGRIRGNGAQLAEYLLTKADNENVYLLDIKGTAHPDNLRRSLLEMSLTSELTKTDKGLYHVQICPAYGEDDLSYDDWVKAAEIMEKEAGFTGQKRVLVIHEKAGKKHCHAVWERYDHEKRKMIPNKYSWQDQDRARATIEIMFEHKRTPERNTHRPKLQEELTSLWHVARSGAEFIELVERRGYAITKGTHRPFIVVDHNGVSCDLVRQLKGINTKEVRERLGSQKLVSEKTAIKKVRTFQKAKTPGPVRTPVNDNGKSLFSMSFSLTVTPEQMQAASLVSTAAINKEAERRKALEQVRQARLKRAKEFRENEQDM